MIETKPWPKAMSIVWYQKLNPIWWFGNIEGLDPGYEPGWPMWKRRLFWFFRNFAFNFFRFVVGFEDQDIVVTGPAPVFTPVWREVTPPSTGWKWALVWGHLFGVVPVPAPFVSYSGKHVLWFVGWVPSGGRLGAKFNIV
jgi:hypothetical protein